MGLGVWGNEKWDLVGCHHSGTTDDEQGKIGLLSQWTMEGWDEQYCKQSDGHLASITSEEIHNYLYSKVDWDHHEKWFWVGGTDQEKENNWRWTDGSPWTFTEWGENQPDKGSEENCLQIERMERPILWSKKNICLQSRNLLRWHKRQQHYWYLQPQTQDHNR